jgi:hypothetical protein
VTGPKYPLSPVGPREVLNHMVVSQRYEDGKLYQISLRRGAPFDAATACFSLIDPIELGRAVWSSVHTPWDLEQYEDDNLYLTLWVANE